MPETSMAESNCNVTEDDIDERGLTQLRHFIDDSVARPTIIGKRHLRQFLAKPYHGSTKSTQKITDTYQRNGLYTREAVIFTLEWIL